MPPSYRRLRLLSTSVMRDGRILLRRETTSGLISSAGGRGFSGCTTNNNNNYSTTTTTTTTTRPHSVFANRQQRRSEATISAARGFTGMASSSSSIVANANQLPSRGGAAAGTVARIASFHSSPLSWFAAEKEEDKKEDATTTTAADDSPPKEESASASATEEESSSDDNDSNDDDEEPEPSATDVTYDIAPSAPLPQASQDKVQAIFDKVLWLDMIEVHHLSQIVNEQMGISWKETEQRQMGRGGGGGGAAKAGGAAEEAPVEEKTIFDLKLLGYDAKAKIKVIKEVRNIAGLGLKEAKEMVEGAPKVIQKELKLEKAEELKAQLEAVGAQVELV